MTIRPIRFSRDVLSIGLLACTIGGSSVSIQGCAGTGDQDDSSLGAQDDSPHGVSENALSGQVNPGPDQILVCPDPNFGGNCIMMGTGLYANSAGVANDTMSSIKVGSGVRVTLCADSAFRGTCQTIDPGRNLGYLGYEAIRDNKVSSVRIVSASTPDCRGRRPENGPPSGWVFLYRDANYQGDCVAVTHGEYWNVLDVGMANDSVSSALIPADAHTGVSLMEHQGYQGQAYYLWISNWDDYVWLSGAFGWFNDLTTSLSVWAY